jgi:hypothetical protein
MTETCERCGDELASRRSQIDGDWILYCINRDCGYDG